MPYANKVFQRWAVARWRVNNRKRWKEIGKKNRDKLKAEVMEHYGGVCGCCAEWRIVFLTIDHINGSGNAHRRETNAVGGTGFYSWLKRNGYPAGFQVRCWNCNAARSILGRCPHEADKPLRVSTKKVYAVKR